MPANLAAGSRGHLALVEATGLEAAREDAPAAARRLAPVFAGRAKEHDVGGTFPHDNVADLHGSGLVALTVPAAAGGGGAGLATATSVVGALAVGDASTALVLAMQYVHHAGIARSASWSRQLARAVQREAVEDGALLNILRVEPELGSPARGGLPATIARRVGAEWRVSGRKIYSTGAPGLAAGLVWARTEGAEPEVGLFLVPMRVGGVAIEETWDQLGMRASGSHDVVLDDVAIPLDHAVDLRAPAEWASPDPDYLAWNTTLIASVYDGVARAARDWFVAFTRERAPSNLGAPLATLPRFQDVAGEIERLLFVNARLLLGAAEAADRGAPHPPAESGFVKLTVTENAIAVVQRIVEAAGNPGLSRSQPLERHLRDVLCARIHTPQADSVRLAAGRAALSP